MNPAPVLASLGPRELRARLRGQGLRLRTGPFGFRIRSAHRPVAVGMDTLYGDMPLQGDQAFVDFDIRLDPGLGMHRVWRPQCRFLFDEQAVFEPLPAPHAFALLEWGMNWCISNHAHHYLIIHAAVLERGGGAMLLPAPPGSGKSTLCAALVHHGWRLLSDELALIDLRDGRLWPLCRPVSLKNRSIDVIRDFCPQAYVGEATYETSKGTVAHMRVPTEHIARMDEACALHWVVFPRYESGAGTALTERSRASTVGELGRNAFNFQVIGVRGFQLLCDLVQQARTFDFRYSRLDEAMSLFASLADVDPVGRQ